jgi:hypothetical protein
MPNRFENGDLVRSSSISREVCVCHPKIGAKSFDEAAPMTPGHSECAILRQQQTELSGFSGTVAFINRSKLCFRSVSSLASDGYLFRICDGFRARSVTTKMIQSFLATGAA